MRRHSLNLGVPPSRHPAILASPILVSWLLVLHPASSASGHVGIGPSWHRRSWHFQLLGTGQATLALSFLAFWCEAVFIAHLDVLAPCLFRIITLDILASWHQAILASCHQAILASICLSIRPSCHLGVWASWHLCDVYLCALASSSSMLGDVLAFPSGRL